MCGIAGLVNRGENGRAVVEKQLECLRHRGPDSWGIWKSDQGNCYLGHRRLAILDLSPGGHQPMISSNGRYAIAFNGEIYNFIEIKKELEQLGSKFQSSSDTEVILEAFCQWGLRKSLRRFNGMFAIALWDNQDNSLSLIRDRMGIKPVYYGWIGQEFVFASELKAIVCHPEFKKEIDRDVLGLYLRYDYIPAPYCIYKGINKLLPGSVMTMNLAQQGKNIDEYSFWKAADKVGESLEDRFAVEDVDSALANLEELLSDSIEKRMISDVPLGAFLSGGIDSSLVVSLMQKQSRRAVKTFTVGFHHGEYNEADDARKIADHLGTDHTEIYVTPKESMDVIPLLPRMYCEPFADPSQIPTFLISKVAREQVTVALSGDGGDELFGGYNRHVWVKKIWKSLDKKPGFLKRFTGKAITSVSPDFWDKLLGIMKPVLPRYADQKQAGDKLHKIARIIEAGSPEEMYSSLISTWSQTSEIALGARTLPTALSPGRTLSMFNTISEKMMFLDMISYLPDDVLTKVDRASMAVALEARVPLLDHRVAELAWKIPLEMKIKEGKGKWILRELLSRHIPRELFDRPKSGFGVPIAQWLRNDLREWAESLLDGKRIKDEGLLNFDEVRNKWDEHLSGRRNWQYQIWNILMFQSWLDDQAR